jgi:hypothetical protein
VNGVLMTNIVTLEMAGVIESWMFNREAVHILLRLQTKAPCCGKPHQWFVNRNGRTLCCECDEKEVARLSQLERTAA